MDDWIDDPDELMRITNLKDTKGNWWEIPIEILQNCSLAQCYLDARGVKFYLPAYMTGVINDTGRKNYRNLICWLAPLENNEDCNLYEYFCEKFSLLDNKQKNVCIEVLNYVQNNIDPLDLHSKDEINQIINHEFWQP
jgi:hypothetical protein